MRRPRRFHAALATLASVVLAGRSGRAQTAPPPETPPAASAPEPAPPTPEPPALPTTILPPPPPAAAPPLALPALPPPTSAPPPSPTSPPPPLPSGEGRGPEGVAWLAPPPSGSARAPAEDPQADRGVLAPTAYTHPKGTTYVSDYELVLVQIGYAITDDTQISFTGFPPIDAAERFALVDLTLKSTLYRGGLVRVAALGSTSGIVAKQTGVLAVGRLGGVVQLCLERRCESSLSLSSNVTLAGVMLMVNGATGIFRLGRTASLLAELDTLVPLGKDAGELNGGMGGGGVRFHWTNWGLDLTLMRVLGSGGVTFPVLALTYRSAP